MWSLRLPQIWINATFGSEAWLEEDYDSDENIYRFENTRQ